MMTRRQFGTLAAVTLPSTRLLAKPDSTFSGVRIGAITYSFRALPSNAEQVLKYCVDCGISGVELMSNVAESYAGVPPMPAARPGDRMTPEQQEARRAAAEALTSWRLGVSMDKYKAFRRMYEDAGVRIYAFKLPPTLDMSDAEYEYIWNVGETLGATHLTMELPSEAQRPGTENARGDELLHRVATYAAKRKLAMAFHTHGRNGSTGFDQALSASKYTMLNLDVGHFYGVNGQSPVPVIEKYHSRIASLHLKDRKGPQAAPADRPGSGGPNMPWGQGETPLKDVLQLMKRNKYKFPASIEYEYETPAGSDVVTEVKKCVEYCRASLK